MNIFRYKYCNTRMSLALLNRELSLANADLVTKEVTVKKKDKPVREQLGTDRHGIKKKIRKMKANNQKKDGKISFKFSEEYNSKSKDQTKETLAMLSKLDSIAACSSTKIVEHILVKKRQKKQGEDEKKKKDDVGSILFTDEDIQNMSKAYFLHSKSLVYFFTKFFSIENKLCYFYYFYLVKITDK